MVIPILGLFETHLNVRDLEKSIAFYRDVMGLELAYDLEARRVAFFWIGAPRWLCSATYVVLGWVALLAAPQLVSSLPLVPLLLVAAGGVLYTAGAVVFALGRPDPWPRVFGFHEIFHVFVILGAIAHFVAMAFWIVPSGPGG